MLDLINRGSRITNRDRAVSPEMFRASRTIQMVEEEFGGSDSPVHKSKAGYRASSIAGKHSEDRILKRATQEVHATALEEKDFFRTVSHLYFILYAIAHLYLRTYFSDCRRFLRMR